MGAARYSIQAIESRDEDDSKPNLVDRRSRVRFPMELRVRFRGLGRGYRVSGMGRLVNMSSGGLLVAHQDGVQIGTLLELHIEWPVRLDGRIPLQIVAVGKVTRCNPSSFAVVLETHQFRLAPKEVCIAEPYRQEPDSVGLSIPPGRRILERREGGHRV